MKTKDLVFTALFMGIVFVMGLWPQLGFIQLGPLVQVTIIHIPVIIAGIFLGRQSGMWVGAAFGVGSFINSLSSGVLFAPVFANPLVSILPRILFGLSVHPTYTLVKNLFKRDLLGYGATAAISTLFHSLMVIPLLFIFGMNQSGIASFITETFNGSIFTFVFGIFMANSVMEIIAAAIISPIILGALYKIQP